MKSNLRIVLLVIPLILVFFIFNFSNDTTGTDSEETPFVVWYTVAKYLQPDFLDFVDAYKPDVVLLTVFAEDDIVSLNGSKDIDLKFYVDELHKREVKVFYSYSLFSRSMYEFIKDNSSLPVEEYLHVSSYAKYLRENNPQEYHKWFDYYLERGINPEEIPMVERKPIDDYYVEVGHYSMIDPLYIPYQNFLIQVINETVSVAKPDGLAFDHIRFFTFDEAYNENIRNYILTNCGLNIYEFTPKPPFVLSATGWSEDDQLYYGCRAELIQAVVENITSHFPEYPKYGTTMGMIDPARANGQYVELQAETFDGLLLMAYDKDSNEVARNVKETVSFAKNTPVILGISKTVDEVKIENVKAGFENGAKGVYLLGYDFEEEVHGYLLEIRKNSE